MPHGTSTSWTPFSEMPHLPFWHQDLPYWSGGQGQLLGMSSGHPDPGSWSGCMLAGAWLQGCRTLGVSDEPTGSHPVLGRQLWSLSVCPATIPDAQFHTPAFLGFLHSTGFGISAWRHRAEAIQICALPHTRLPCEGSRCSWWEGWP